MICHGQRSGGSQIEASPGIVRENLSQKYPTQKRAGGVTEVVEHLPNKCEALSSNSNITHTHTHKSSL
jgi:hypothetical protein